MDLFCHTTVEKETNPHHPPGRLSKIPNSPIIKEFGCKRSCRHRKVLDCKVRRYPTIPPNNKPKMPKRSIDWLAWQDKYVYSTCTLEQLSALEGAPALDTLKKRCGRERWTEKRTLAAHQIGTRAKQIAETGIAEVRARHARFGKAALAIAAKGLAHIKPEDLGDLGVSRLARVGAEIERKALGLETLTLRFEELSDEQLERIAAGEDPDKVLGD